MVRKENNQTGVNSLACQGKGLKSDFFFWRVDGPIDARAYNLLEFHIITLEISSF